MAFDVIFLHFDQFDSNIWMRKLKFFLEYRWRPKFFCRQNGIWPLKLLAIIWFSINLCRTGLPVSRITLSQIKMWTICCVWWRRRLVFTIYSHTGVTCVGLRCAWHRWITYIDISSYSSINRLSWRVLGKNDFETLRMDLRVIAVALVALVHHIDS